MLTENNKIHGYFCNKKFKDFHIKFMRPIIALRNTLFCSNVGD